MQPPTSLFAAVVTLGLSSVAEAVCTGNVYAIGTATPLTTGQTQWNIYDTSCNIHQSYQQPSTWGQCDSAVFHCNFMTADFGQYDEPTTGWAYNCTRDALLETCGGSDRIMSCCYPFWGQGLGGDGNPLQS